MQTLLSPVLVVSQAIGITSFYWRNKTRLGCLYRLLFCIIMMGSFISLLPNINFWEEQAAGLYILLIKLDLYSWWFSYFSNLHITTLRNKRITAVIDRLNTVSIELSPRTASAIFRFHLIITTTNFVLICLFTYLGWQFAFDVWNNSNYKFHTSLVYLLGDLTTLTCSYLFAHVINVIGYMFEEINDSLQKIRQQTDRLDRRSPNIYGFDVEEVIKLRKCHFHLGKICAEVNDCFSEQLLIILYFSMVQAVYGTRSILANFATREITESLLNVFRDSLWMLPYIISIIQIVAICDRTTNESKKILKTIHHFMNVYYYDGDAVEELRIFALQVFQHPIRFNARVFTLNYPFLKTLLSWLITYFVVIATFQSESEKSQLPVGRNGSLATTKIAKNTTDANLFSV